MNGAFGLGNSLFTATTSQLKLKAKRKKKRGNAIYFLAGILFFIIYAAQVF